MLENKYVVFQAKKYFMTLSLKIWILSLSQRLLCFWSFQYYALKVSQFSSIKSCMYFQYISQMLVRCWQQNYPKMSPAQSMVCLPLKGTSPIIPEMQDLSKMPFTSVSSGCFFQLSVNYLKALCATPAFPPKKEERDFTPLLTDGQGALERISNREQTGAEVGCSQKQGEGDVVVRS